jgi:proteic killer suppression protein
LRYYNTVIVDFACAETERIFNGQRSRRLPQDIQQTARRKLGYLQFAGRLDDLRMPPGNRLEALRGDRAGQYSIRINQQWRIFFLWRAGNAEQVQIVDYH